MYKNKNADRQTNEEVPKLHVRDANVPLTWRPTESTFNPFINGPAKYVALENTLNHEVQEKYVQKHQGTIKANVEAKAYPKCFDGCIKTINDSYLNPDEKN